MIKSIQSYRGLACLLVLLYHASGLFEKYFGAPTPFVSFFDFGYSGVSFFFVLSGFIIHKVHQKDFDKPHRLITFIKKRIVRIYPIYWIITLLFVPIFWLVPSFGQEHHTQILPLIKSLFLLPQDNPPHLSVAWTLVHEVLFYTLFSLVIINKRIAKLFFTFWFGSIFILYMLDIQNHSFIFSSYNLLFGLGILASYINKKLTESDDEEFAFISFILGCFLFVFFSFRKCNALFFQFLVRNRGK